MATTDADVCSLGSKAIDVGRPEMKDLYKVVQQLSAACVRRRNVWRRLGYELSLSRTDLNIIEVDHQNSVEDRCLAMFEVWLERQFDASWKKLREALIAVELHHLASIVSNWLLPKEMSCCTVNVNNETESFVISEEEFRSYGNDVGNAFLKLQARVTLLLTNANCGLLKRACIARTNNPISGGGVVELSKEMKDKILTARNTDNLFDLLADSPYWNWIDIRLMEAMVAVAENTQAHELLGNYKTVIFSKPLLDVLPNVPSEEVKKKYYARVVAKAEKDKTIAKARKDMTVGDLANFQSPLMKVVTVDINNCFCNLEQLEKVCVE